ncbi:calcium signal-modulating cyclophilin ligand [Erpetoichthys calabaricus]|uniref:calcium signal-modulating cyclophilin ligand n=1 Tax=Erpetoichthys calabaricus TaxID=27687 RepID=UPI00223493AE|nr:calcium signal-modulating cyclophilin ligand [Erpetoichthys calabaricus]
MEQTEQSMPNVSEEKGNLSASKRRAEIRRRKLLMNSEERMKRITSCNKGDAAGHALNSEQHSEPRVPVQLDKPESLTSSGLSKRLTVYSDEDTKTAAGLTNHQGHLDDFQGTPICDSRNSMGDVLDGNNDSPGELRIRPRSEMSIDGTQRSPRRGLHQYLSRFDEAMNLRTQLINEKPAPESSPGNEELDAFRIFRLMGSVILAVVVRMFVCKYLCIFAPFLTLQLAYMGLYKYFPKGEKKIKTTVLTAALLLSGIPSEVINRSMDTYSKMGDVFTDLCVYFFTFIITHEMLVILGSETPS